MENKILSQRYNTQLFQTTIVFILSISLLLLNKNLLIISIETRRVLVSILFMILFGIKVKKLNTKNKWLCIFFLISCFGFFYSIYNTLYLLLFYNFIFIIFCIFFPTEFYKRCLLSIFIYTLLYYSYQSGPFIFYALDYCSIQFSKAVSSFFYPHKLGASASGLHIIIPFIVFFLMLYRKNLRNITLFTLSIMLVWGIFQASGKILLSGFAQVTSQIIIIPMLFIMFYFLQPVNLENKVTNKTFLPTIMFWILLVAIVVSGSYFDISSQKNKKILFYENGFFDLKVPTFEKFGALEGGLFGLLPEYLANYGYTYETLKGDVKKERLKGVGIFVVTNPQKDWTDDELLTIWNFVNKGGSLLVMGDHTNIMGTQPVLNKLLEPVHMKFNFDSGFPCRGEWKYCLSTFLHPITSHVKNYHDMSISVGATLSVQYPSFPVVIGKYGFSDFGDYFNTQGAYLGNYTYELGEKIGDVILVAANNYGKGKVLVFGDTSSFQNGALSTSFPHFVFQIFEWLSQSKGQSYHPILTMMIICLLIFTFYFFNKNASFVMIVISISIFCATLVVVQSITMKNYQFKHANEKKLWVSMSNNERLALLPFQRNSCGALLNNALRNGFITYFMEKFDIKTIMKGKVFISVAPAKAFTQQEVGQLKAFMHQGGLVIISTGYNDKSGSLPILKAFDLDISGTPLGPVPIVKDKKSSKDDLQFVSAWPIVDVSPGFEQNLLKVRISKKSISYVNGKAILTKGSERKFVPVRNDIDIIYRHKAYAIVISKKVGKGYLVVIADSLFLGEKNIEDIKTYNEGNIYFLKSLFELIGGAR